MSQLVEVTGLRVQFSTRAGTVTVVDGVSFTLEKGGALAILGESGSGKSVLAQALIGLLPSPGEVCAGEVIFRGESLATMSSGRLSQLRGGEVGFLFQNPGATLNPLQRAGRQISNVVRTHCGLDQSAAKDRALELLEAVEFADPAGIAATYPHELSGGMQQRVALALALAGEPKLLIADEPTAALDASVREDVLKLLSRLRRELGLTIMVITHDLRVAERLADRVLLFYSGKVVEDSPADAFFEQALHPYGRALLRCQPGIALANRALPSSIPGDVPDFRSLPGGCRFHPRCALAQQECRRDIPDSKEINTGHRVACHLVTNA
jgi:oligopeptide/dipeptide ABC transporter ATP-binding protein